MHGRTHFLLPPRTLTGCKGTNFIEHWPLTVEHYSKIYESLTISPDPRPVVKSAKRHAATLPPLCSEVCERHAAAPPPLISPDRGGGKRSKPSRPDGEASRLDAKPSLQDGEASRPDGEASRPDGKPSRSDGKASRSTPRPHPLPLKGWGETRLSSRLDWKPFRPGVR